MRTLQTKWNLLPAVLIVIVAIFTACGGAATPSSSTTTSPTTTGTLPATFQPKLESLEEILSRADLIAQVGYDISLQGPEDPLMTAKVWVKGKQARMELNLLGINIVEIVNTETMKQYNYLPDKKMAAQVKYDSTASDMQVFPREMANYILKSKPVMLRSETYDGKDCAVVEYDSKAGNRETGWIWKARGLLLKSVYPDAKGQVITDLKKVSFQDISDSLFKLPGEVRLVSEKELEAVMSGQLTPTAPRQYFPNQYKSDKWGYSIQYPDNWKVDSSNPDLIVIKGSEAWIIVSVLKFETFYLEEWLEINEKQLTKDGIQYQVLTEEVKTLSDGTPFVALATKNTSDKSSVATQNMVMLAVANGCAMRAVASTLDIAWEKHGETLGRMLDSVRFN